MPTNTPPIIILATAANGSGDLFTELLASFFSTVGYEQCRFNVHKSGREIDVDGQHRLEEKRLIAECKATGEKIGGGDINKFVGAYDAEKIKSSTETVGYFVSLNGFTETAIQQEKDLGVTRVLLIDGHSVVRALINGRILVPEQVAYGAAAICAAGYTLIADPAFEILAHPLGFIWAIYFLDGKKRTHVALIHADGTPLHEDVASEMLLHPHFSGFPFVYLPKQTVKTLPEATVAAVKAEYFSYLDSECGVIQLEGLPADQEVGSRKLRLESIFVPSHLIASLPSTESSGTEDIELAAEESDPAQPESDLSNTPRQTVQRIPAGTVLTQDRRIAILGLPGSGKSTLLKRLSTAYAFPHRLGLVDDSLPAEKHFPIFIRCRQLGDKVRDPILELLRDLSRRLEMSDAAADAFSELIQESLRRGDALLLVDGLDEIAGPSDRVAFVTQLRTFLHRYPAISLVVTSREAGFRIVGSALSTVCRHFVLDDFDNNDIMRLTLGWHKEVVGDRPDIAAEAQNLGAKICSIPRVRQLAGNPLLLTTLLLVRRWVGSLPTKRSVLYAKAIEVLLATWNVEGHAPLEQDEVLPQLEYLAFSMLRSGTQQIGLQPLRALLIEAREAMPEILSYTKISPGELIDRIELRSSLLMQSGMDIVDGVLMPVYEFRHLTFQEFLCAQAIVNNHFPGASDEDTPVSVLKPYIGQESWKEAVLLTMVLAGKRAAPIVQELMARTGEGSIGGKASNDASPAALLLDGLIDEVQLSPDLLREALESVIATRDLAANAIISLHGSKYQDALSEVAQRFFFSEGRQLLRSGTVLVHIFALQRGLILERNQPFSSVLAEELGLDLTGARGTNALAIDLLLVMEHAYAASAPQLPKRERGSAPSETEHLLALAKQIRPYFTDARVQIRAASIWAFNWLNNLVPSLVDEPAGLMRSLFEQLLHEENLEVQYLLGWAISTFDLLPRDQMPLGVAGNREALWIEANLASTGMMPMYNRQEKRSALIVSYYLRHMQDSELLARIDQAEPHFDRHLLQIQNKLKTGTPTQPAD